MRTTMVYFYSDFIEKLIHAGRSDGTKPYFRFGEEIDRGDFAMFANRFIENYYATVPPDFARKYPMKFSFASISSDGALVMNRTIKPGDIDQYPGINAGILYIDPMDGRDRDSHTLDGSIFRQACFIRRENRKFWTTMLGVGVAIAAFIFSSVIRK
jgi:hypothetical protein